ncbi:MAG: polyphosphate--glucose phosphotransferase [Saprospiraceae bacterium]
MQILGIDIGGTGIKGGVVDTDTGQLLTERVKVLTPVPSTPKSVAKVVNDIAAKFDFKGPIGLGFPAIIRKGIVCSASNIDHSWIGTNSETLFTEETGQPCFVANDADVAGFAEMAYGEVPSSEGVVLFLTIGTGIGSALFIDGKLVPNSEMGHLYWTNGEIAEKYISNKVRKAEGMSWELFGKRLNRYLLHIEKLFSPELIIIGGGISKDFGEFKSQLTLPVKVIPAILQNSAGVIGAAMYARSRMDS